MKRRDFLGAALLAGVSPRLDAQATPAGDDRIAQPTGAGYDSPLSDRPGQTCWVQVDLGSSRKVDAVKLYPKLNWMGQRSQGFPVRFRIDLSDDARFLAAAPIVDETGADYPDPADRICAFRATGAIGRYVRVTVTQLKSSGGRTPRYGFSLAKIDALSDGKDAAEGRPAADSSKGELGVTPADASAEAARRNHRHRQSR
jgi:hypothetical protein